MYGNMMYGPWGPPPVYGGYPPRGLTIAEAIEGEEFFKKLRKEMKEHEDKEKRKKPEFKKFTFLETVGLMVIFGPIVGVSYLYFFQAVMQNVNQILNVTPH